MADRISKEERSRNMAAITGKDTKPEMIVRKFLFSRGFRYRLHDKKLPGKPDIVLLKYKTVIFINGCFWHGHDCKKAKLPSTNVEFWQKKIQSNIERDKRVGAELAAAGWRVLTVWQCEISPENMEKLSDKISSGI